MPETYEAWNNDRLDRVLSAKGNLIERIGDVDRSRDKLAVRCTVCGHQWQTTPQTLVKSGCPACYRKSRLGGRRKAKYTAGEVAEILNRNGFELLSGEPYVNNKVPLTILNRETGETEHISLRSFQSRGSTKYPKG